MTARDLGTVGLTLMGVLALVLAIETATLIFGLSFISDEDAPNQLSNVLPGMLLTLAMVALGISIMAYADFIAGRLLPESGTLNVAITSMELQVVLFSAVGALLLFESLPELLRELAVVIPELGNEPGPSTPVLFRTPGSFLAGTLLHVLFGLLLLFGARPVVSIVRRLGRIGPGRAR